MPEAISASHIFVSACDITIPGDCMLLLNTMKMGLGDGKDSKTKKIHPDMHDTVKHLPMRGHALSLNIQISTNIQYMLVWVW